MLLFYKNTVTLSTDNVNAIKLIKVLFLMHDTILPEAYKHTKSSVATLEATYFITEIRAYPQPQLYSYSFYIKMMERAT